MTETIRNGLLGFFTSLTADPPAAAAFGLVHPLVNQVKQFVERGGFP